MQAPRSDSFDPVGFFDAPSRASGAGSSEYVDQEDPPGDFGDEVAVSYDGGDYQQQRDGAEYDDGLGFGGDGGGEYQDDYQDGAPGFDDGGGDYDNGGDVRYFDDGGAGHRGDADGDYGEADGYGGAEGFDDGMGYGDGGSGGSTVVGDAFDAADGNDEGVDYPGGPTYDDGADFAADDGGMFGMPVEYGACLRKFG